MSWSWSCSGSASRTAAGSRDLECSGPRSHSRAARGAKRPARAQRARAAYEAVRSARARAQWAFVSVRVRAGAAGAGARVEGAADDVCEGARRARQGRGGRRGACECESAG
jgi:hypothetical protein